MAKGDCFFSVIPITKINKALMITIKLSVIGAFVLLLLYLAIVTVKFSLTRK